MTHPKADLVPPHHHHPNGTHVSVKWLIGTMGAIIGAGSLLFISDMAERQRDNADRVGRLELRANQLEIDMAALRVDLAYIRTTLLRIEEKLE